MVGSATGDQTSGLLGAFHDTRILEVLDENTVFYQLADKRPIQQRNGNVITFHTISKLADGSVLTQGVQPTTQFMTAGTKTATLTQFGGVTAISDVMAKAGIADLLMLAAERFGKAAAVTVDKYIQDRLYSEVAIDNIGNLYHEESPLGTSTYNAAMTTWMGGIKGGLSAIFMSTNYTTITPSSYSVYFSTGLNTTGTESITGLAVMNLKKIRKVVSMLESANVKPFGDTYAFVMRPEVVAALREDPEWREWNRYNDASKMFKGEVGMVENCRIIKTTNALKFNYKHNASITAYLSTILGNQAFAITEFSGDTGINMYDVPFSNKDSGNVLQQNAYVGWKWTGVAKVLDSNQGYGLITHNG